MGCAGLLGSRPCIEATTLHGRRGALGLGHGEGGRCLSGTVSLNMSSSSRKGDPSPVKPGLGPVNNLPKQM